ncbi:MAG: hypothetical protein AAF997_21610 [Myxococcota bacterium]
MTRWLALIIGLASISSAGRALAWEPLRTENTDVKKGNALMSEEKYGEALMSYDEAAAELPESKGVQLNRGLALLAQDATEQAKEAFLSAADPSAPKDVRADAYYDLGVTFGKQGDLLADKEELEPAMENYREAVDAFKRSLRVRPGDRDAAWNLEYALQRIREQEEKKQQQQQEQDEQEQDEQDQDQQQDQQNQDEQQQEQEQDQQNQDEQQQEQDEQEQDSQDPQTDNQQSQPEPSEAPPPRDEVERFLDALEQNEESLPVERARRESAGRRKPEKDW